MATEHRFELDFAEPHIDGPCPCCGGMTVRGTGFVSVDDAAYAVYYVRYANNHPDRELALIVSIGDFTELSDASAREAFYARLRPHEATYALMLDDAADSPWGDVELLGRKLTREEALAHPLVKTLFALTDEIGGRDPRVRGYFERAACGDTGIPLEPAFDMPDEVLTLPENERAERVQIGRDFVVLDGDRWFVRALVGFEVEHYGEWAVGAWVEVAADTYRRVWDAWDEPAQYLALDFEGTLVNDLQRLDLPAPCGIRVRVRARHADEALRISDSLHAPLRERRAESWSRDAFEMYAVARGYL